MYPSFWSKPLTSDSLSMSQATTSSPLFSQLIASVIPPRQLWSKSTILSSALTRAMSEHFLSSAFRTVDHQLMLDILHHRFCISGPALAWFGSYLSGRAQVIRVNGQVSNVVNVHCGVPQGSVLGPKDFTSYAEDNDLICEAHGLCHHSFADDTQSYNAQATILSSMHTLFS